MSWFGISKVYIEAFHVDGVGARPIGERISQLPLEPQYGRVLVAAAELGCVSEALMLAMFSCFSSSDVFITMSFVIISVEETGAKDLGFPC